MKFNKSDIPKMGGAALITALIFIAINFWGNKNKFSFSSSERISWNRADKLKGEYMGFKPMNVEYKDPATGKDIVTELEGFKMDARQIDEIINHNKHTGSTDSTADEIIFYFGMDGKSGPWYSRFANLHIIAAGIKNNTLLKNREGSNDVESSIFDKADPCPPYCPQQ